MRLGIAMPERHISKPILDAALEATTRLDESLLQSGAPLFEDVAHRIKWRPEPPGQEEFDHLGRVLRRRAGDCDDLAPYHAASLRHSGEDPDASAEVYRSGPGRWHAVVRRGDGGIDDPSKWCGMRRGVKPFVAGVVGGGAIITTGVNVGGVGAFTADPRVMLRPRREGAWESRVDLPYDFVPWRRSPPGLDPADVAMATLHTAPLPSQAVAGACAGAARLARQCAPDDTWCTRYLLAQHAVHAHDWDWEDVAEEYGEDIADAVEDSVGCLWHNVGIKIRAPKFVRDIVDKGRDVITSPAAAAVMPWLPGGAGVLMATHGGLAAEKAARGGGNVLDIARGGFGGAARGALVKLENPLFKAGVKRIPIAQDVAKWATKAAKLAAKADADAPTLSRPDGAPKKRRKGKGKTSKGVKRKRRIKRRAKRAAPSKGKAVFSSPRKVVVHL